MRKSIALLCVLTFLAAAHAGEGERHAILVGVQDYSGTTLANLRYCDDDAGGLADVLAGQGYTRENITLMTRKASRELDQDALRPTAKNIRTWLEFKCRVLRPEDSIVIAFAGHGVELKDFVTEGGEKKEHFTNYFCPLESDLTDVKTLISLDEVFATLKSKCAARVKLMIVDACRDEPGKKGAEHVLRLVPEPPGGIVALYSCGTGQTAFESDKLKHGVFFYYLIEGLKGAARDVDGKVTVSSLEGYLAREVQKRVVAEFHNPGLLQTPERSGKTIGEVVLTLPGQVPVLEKKLEPDGSLTLDLGNGIKMEFVRVTAGTFQMGSEEADTEAEKDEKPVHSVKISKDYFIGKYPVTVAQFRRFVEETGHRTEAEKSKGGYTLANKDWKVVEGVSWRNPGFDQSDEHPVVLVSWNDTQAFMQWACTQFKREVRLPMEAEWEYAARGPKSVKYPWGNFFDGTKCNHADLTLKNSGLAPDNWPHSTVSDGYSFTSPVGHFDNASWCGAKDMAGNVWQWCQDKYEEKYYQSRPNLDADPKGPATGLKVKGTFDDAEIDARVLRGGSWGDQPADCRSASRLRYTPANRDASFGFRCVLPLD